MATNRDIVTLDSTAITQGQARDIMLQIAQSGMPTGLTAQEKEKAKSNIAAVLKLFDLDDEGKYVGVRTFTGFIAQVLLADGFADAIPAKYVSQSLGWIRRTNIDRGDKNEVLFDRTLLLLQAIDKTKDGRSDLLPLVTQEWLALIANKMVDGAYYSQAIEFFRLTQDPQKPQFKISPNIFVDAVKARGDYLTSGDPAREDNKRFFTAYVAMAAAIWEQKEFREGLSAEQMQKAFHHAALYWDDKDVLAHAKVYVQDPGLAGGIASGLKNAANVFLGKTPPTFGSAVDYYDFLTKSGQPGAAAEIVKSINATVDRLLSGKETNLPLLAGLQNLLSQRGHVEIVDKLLDRVRDAGVALLQPAASEEGDIASTRHVVSLMDILDRTGQKEVIKQMMAAAGETTRRLVFVPGTEASQAKYVTTSIVMDIRSKNVLSVYVPQDVTAKDNRTRLMGYTRWAFTPKNIVSQLHDLRSYYKYQRENGAFDRDHTIPSIIQGLVEQAALAGGKANDPYAASAKALLDKIKSDRDLRKAYSYLWDNKGGGSNRPATISTRISPPAANAA